MAIISRRQLIVVLSVCCFFPLSVFSQIRTNLLELSHDPRGAPELTVCSQNLENFGSLKDMVRRVKGMNQEKRSDKLLALVKRIQETGCDVIAVQELLGSKEEKAKESLEEIIHLLKFRTNRDYVPYVGPSNDKISRVGFIVAKEGIQFGGLMSLVRVELPKISEEAPPRLFARGPLEIRLRVSGKGKAPARDVILTTFHFKSRAFNSGDGSDLSWETYRMEMAEAVRRVVTRRNEETLKGNGSIFILLGDRNSNFDTASAKILTGELILPRFQGPAPCRLNKRGVPLCQPGSVIPPAFVSVLTGDSQTFRTPGTYLYKKTFSWLDEVLLPVKNLPFAYAKAGMEGDYDSGTVTQYKEASDHAMVYVRLNW